MCVTTGGLSYRLATISDFSFFLELKFEVSAIKMSGFKTAPDKMVLLTYLGKAIFTDYEREIFIIEDDGMPVGYFCIVKSSEEAVFTPSVGILEKHRGKGYGTFAIKTRIRIAKHEGYKTCRSG